MTLRVEKEVIRPGTYWYEDPVTHTPKKAVITAESVRYLHDQGKEMLKAGLSIPVPLEHQKLVAMTPAEKAAVNLANNAGWVADYKMKKIKDEATGQEVEALFSDTEILDPKIAENLPRTIRWTSPYISSFMDGNGKKWDRVISHLALTTRPRIVKQQPFPSVAAAMSLAESLRDEPPTTDSDGVVLSRAGLLKRMRQTQGERWTPTYPIAFGLWTGIGFAMEMETEEKPKAKKAKKDKMPPKKDGEEEEEGAEGREEEIVEELIDEEGDISIYNVTADLLDALGIPMEQSDESNFLHNLYKAVMAQIKGDNGMTTPATNPTNPAANNKAPVIQEQPPLYMSLEQVQTIQDPVMRSIALSNIKLQEQIGALSKRHESLEKNALDSARLRRQTRIDRLSTKLAPATKEKLVAAVATAQFSLGDDGIVTDSLDSTLTLLEESIPDLPELLTRDVSAFSVQPHPKEYGGQMSEERRKQVVEEACKNGGIRTPSYHAASQAK